MKIKKILLSFILSVCVGCNSLGSEKYYSSAKQLSFPTEREYDSIGLYRDQVIAFDNETVNLYFAIEDETAFEQIPDKRNVTVHDFK